MPRSGATTGCTTCFAALWKHDGCAVKEPPGPTLASLQAALAERDERLLAAAAKAKEDELAIEGLRGQLEERRREGQAAVEGLRREASEQIEALRRDGEAAAEGLRRQASEQAALLSRLHSSLLAAQAVHRAEVKACLRQWAAETATLQERLGREAARAAELQEQLDRETARAVELEARLSEVDEPERSGTLSSIGSSLLEGDSPGRTYSYLTVDSSPLEAGLVWTGEGEAPDEEAEQRVKPMLRRMRSSCMEELALPPDASRMEELAAASLSQWIYSAEVAGRDPVQPDLSHLPFAEVQAHCVLEDVRLGSLKVATATVQVPGGRKDFFVVFKGTSYLLDVANWNVEHDYKETGDPVSFVHKGAAGMVRNLLFLKLETDASFLLQMQLAHQQGARRLVLAGHSLGGLYAQAMLLSVFKQLRGKGPVLDMPPGARQLLEGARCVTFGAPMCFGSDPGKQQSPEFLEFEAFMRERAVNYVHENDPCPRAWSAVEPRDLMAKAAEALKREILMERGSVKGRIASKVVDAAMQGIVTRPDFDRQIVGCSKDFRHLARIRLLSRRNKRCLHWRSDFHLSRQGFEDHAVARYVERLTEASSSERPSCQIYDDDELGSKITLLHLVS